MCYEQGKKRIYYNKIKTGSTNQPLIKDKKITQEITKEKQNQKINIDMQMRNKNHYFTDQYRNGHQGNKHQFNMVETAQYHGVDRNANIYVQKNDYFQHNTRTLTFGNVRTQVPKIKDEIIPLFQQNVLQNNYIELKKPLLATKPINFIEKTQKIAFYEKNIPTQRQRNMVQKIQLDKKQKNSKLNQLAKKISHNTTQISQIDDFACNEQLQIKPVEKKSLIPEKKQKNTQKTTSKFDFIKSKKVVQKRNQAKELKDFQTIEKSININTEAESLIFMTMKQQEYSVAPGYIQKTQKAINWWSRGILVDWMRHICYQFALQRDTYHIAVVLLDNYIEKTPNIPKSIFQGIGVTTLFIASKLEEFQCKQSAQFSKTTNNSCKVEDIHDLEIKIVKALKFKINPPTLSALANKIMIQWDAFIDSKDSMSFHSLFGQKQKIHFKTMEERSYRLFRSLMQMLDCSVIDVQTAQYKLKMLVCSFIYLLLGVQLNIFNPVQIVKEFPGSSLYLLEDNSEFNDLFRSFVEYCFGFSLFQILPTVQYAATYFDLILTFQKPLIAQQDDLDFMSLQEYCSYQTYNSGMIKIVKNRYRGIY